MVVEIRKPEAPSRRAGWRRETEVLTRRWYDRARRGDGGNGPARIAVRRSRGRREEGSRRRYGVGLQGGSTGLLAGGAGALSARQRADARPTEILNNIAVAQEANGLYEQALLTYQTGLSIDPGNRALQRNYARFQEFYASYIAPPEEITEPEDEGKDDAKQDN